MADVEQEKCLALQRLKLEGQLSERQIKADVKRQRQLSEIESNGRGNENLTYPIDKARADRKRKRRTSREQAVKHAADIMTDDPDIPKTTPAYRVGISRSTLYEYLPDIRTQLARRQVNGHAT